MWILAVAGLKASCSWRRWPETNVVVVVATDERVQWAKSSCSFNNLFSVLKSGLISNRPIPVRQDSFEPTHQVIVDIRPIHSLESGDIFFAPLIRLRPHTDLHAKVERDPFGCQTSEIVTQRCWRVINTPPPSSVQLSIQVLKGEGGRPGACLRIRGGQGGFVNPVLITISPTRDHPSSSFSLHNQGDGAYLCGERAIEERVSHCHLWQGELIADISVMIDLL